VFKILLLLFLATPAFSSTITLPKDRTVFINGEVTGAILNQANKVYELSTKSTDPIYLVINSPGGGVFAGLQMITAIRLAQQRGVEIKCIVTLMAASMAFQIFAECDTRYAFENTLLLFHPMTMGGRFNSQDMQYNAEIMRALEGPLLRTLQEKLRMSRYDFYKHYYRQTLWTSYMLNTVSPDFVTTVDDVKGLPELFSPMD
jgi:ATP-dependent protease ClpP protease subunit